MDTDEELLKTGRAGEGYRLSYRAFGSSVHLRFTPLGFTLAHNGTFKLCPADNDPRYARALIVSKTARFRLSGDRDGDDIHEDASGDALACP